MRRRQRGVEVVRLAHFARVAQGDGGFDDTPIGRRLQPKPLPGLRFDIGGGHVLGLDHHG